MKKLTPEQRSRAKYLLRRWRDARAEIIDEQGQAAIRMKQLARDFTCAVRHIAVLSDILNGKWRGDWPDWVCDTSSPAAGKDTK